MNPASRSSDLLPDELLALGRLPPDLLLHRVCVRVHSQVVLERAFLFAAKITADSDDLGGVFAHHDLLCRNGGIGSESGFG